MILTILVFLIILSVLVLVHEFGHFIIGKINGIKIEEFALGLPFTKPLFSKKLKDGMKISLYPLLFGGFVKLLGEDADEKSKNSFSRKTVWQRIAVVIAGVVMNLFLAVFAFYIFLTLSGFKVLIPKLADYKFISPNYNLYHHGQVSECGVDGKYYQCLLNNCLENFSDSLLATLEAYFVAGKGYKNMINKYLSPSNFLRAKFVKAGFDEKNILYLPNAITDNNFKMSSGDLDYVAFVGRLSDEKGLKYLLGAAGKLSNIRFVIVGDGPQRVELEKIKNDNQLNNVEFVGQKNGVELDSLIAGARLLVLPAVWYENAPLSILEAKAHGKIIVASDIGGISEMLPKELLVKPADEVALSQKIDEWFNKNETDRQAMSERLFGQASAENRPEIYLQRLLKVYSE